MSVQTVTDMRAFEDALTPTLHAYPRDPRYRLSGARVPQIGDIARCGHVKQDPPNGKYLSEPPSCAACRSLS